MADAEYAFLAPEERFEIIDGVKCMSPSGTNEHNTIIGNVFLLFANYFWRNKRGRVFTDSLDVHFGDGNLLMPDVKVVLDTSIIKPGDVIYGVPDLVVEVLSPSTLKNDRGKKKNVYEHCGVREYWIIDPWRKSIEVYHLIDGRYELDEVYQLLSDQKLNAMSDAERARFKFEIKVSLFDDLIIDVRDVFMWID